MTVKNHSEHIGIVLSELPTHVSVIMDGNRRWAKNAGVSLLKSYSKGADNLENLCILSKKHGIKYLSAFALSTENLNRPNYELSIIKSVLKRYIRRLLELQREQKINFKAIGNLDYFDATLRNMIVELESKHYSNEMTLIIAMNYSGKDDIINAFKRYIVDHKDKPSMLQSISDDDIESRLMTADYPTPDLLIRTSGEKRMSNFMLWQLAYTEMYFTDKYWPDFQEQDFIKALSFFSCKERRYGQ